MGITVVVYLKSTRDGRMLMSPQTNLYPSFLHILVAVVQSTLYQFYTGPPTSPSPHAETLQNPENLLIFAAGNEGDLYRSSCTMGSPAIAKNILAVGATSSGSTHLSATEADGGADIDTIAYFSSYGPTVEGRIKPEVVAPGDYVRTILSNVL